MHASAKERCGMSNSLTRGVGDALVWINKVFLCRMARFAGGGAGALVLVTALFAVTESAGASPSWKVLSSPKGGGLPLGLLRRSARFLRCGGPRPIHRATARNMERSRVDGWDNPGAVWDLRASRHRLHLY